MLNRFTANGRPLPPAFGTITLPECVDFHTTHNPNETLYIFNEDGSSEITRISYLEFGRACDRLAHHIRPARQGPDNVVVAIVALSDTLLYHAASVGVIRAGLRPFLMSPRNTAEMIVKMMSETSCHRILTTEKTLQGLVDNVRALYASSHPSGPHLIVDEMPPLLEIYPRLGCESVEDPFEPYPKPSAKPSLDDVMIYLHSSGSTGMPKTIPHTYRSFIHWGSFVLIDDIAKQTPQVILGCMPLPCFHTIGVMTQLIQPMYSLVISAIYPPTATTQTSTPITPTPDNILDHMRRTNTNGMITVPMLIGAWVRDAAKLEYLASMSFIIYSGAPMPPKVGNLLTKAGVRLSTIYGGTEFGCPSIVFANLDEPEGWEYVAFDRNVNIRWAPQGDGTYELQFLTCDYHHLVVENMGNERGYATSDLWVPHPTDPTLWKTVGRKDDVIMHTSGEKTVPAPMENIIITSSYVRAAVYFGRNKDQPGVLIEMAEGYVIDPTNPSDVTQARNIVWPIVEEANKLAPGFSKVFKELILISSPSKPLPRAGKGTVMRKAALVLYHDEIEAIYTGVDTVSSTQNVSPPEDWSTDNIEIWLTKQLEDIVPEKNFVATTNLVDHGLDSLGVTILRRRISAALRASQGPEIANQIPAEAIYQHPSLEELSAFISNLVADPTITLAPINRVDAVEQMIERHSRGLRLPVPPSGNTSGKICVLITGTTGSLGAYLLNTFLHNPDIHTIYSYNRPSVKQSIFQRHHTRFLELGLDAAGLRSPKIVFLEGSLTTPTLGLSQEVYAELLKNVTIIVHSAWTVNFNLPLSSFDSNIAGTRKLLDLARACRHGSSTRFIFTSSISSAASWDQNRGPYPEEVILDAKYSVGTGYGESKYISERMLSISGIEATSVRIGQISGGQPNGAWPTTEWFPILVKSSVALGVIPSMPRITSWIPMHAVSRGILDIALSSEVTPAYNFVHPRPIEWEALVQHIGNALVHYGLTSSPLPLVSYDDWLFLLEVRVLSATPELMQQMPAIKLFDFFCGLKPSMVDGPALDGAVKKARCSATFATYKAQQISEEIAYLPPLSSDDVSLWVRYWKSVGFIAQRS
ncbi:hypothetical protein BJ165DRAFT_1479638 [Panaeolus papilionaceus]|nr:hypothetical protein BJ165DRAFT_1479638 [Panaeolus papilionaceus]